MENSSGRFFFSGSETVRMDRAGRLVIPQHMRLGLVENGALECTVALGVGGSLAIYRQSDIQRMVAKFREKEHLAKYQHFFTLFFSTMTKTTCDDKGRIMIPALLKNAIGIDGEADVVVAGVLNKIEIWKEDVYKEKIQAFLGRKESAFEVTSLFEEAFSETTPLETLQKLRDHVNQPIA